MWVLHEVECMLCGGWLIEVTLGDGCLQRDDSSHIVNELLRSMTSKAQASESNYTRGFAFTTENALLCFCPSRLLLLTECEKWIRRDVW